MENKPSPSPSPKFDIPDGWVKNGHCPACGASGLKVTHLDDLADYLTCPKCEISFEVETGGRHIRLKYLPDALEFMDALLHNRWVEAARLSAIIAKHRPVAHEKKIPQQPAAIATEDEIWNRALRMYRMGNKPGMIHLMLLQSGLAQDQANAIFVKLKKMAEEDEQRQNQKFWAVAGISLLVIFLLAGGWLLMSGKLLVSLGVITATPSPANVSNPSSALGLLLNLVPANAQPDLMNLPDTTVDTTHGPAQAACPATPDSAAKLFGGKPAMWMRNANQFPSWQLISASDSITVSLPKGMSAAYVDNKSFQFLSVHGPAIMRNVNFMVISCD